MASKHRSLLKYSNKVSAPVVALRESSRPPWTISFALEGEETVYH